MNVAGGTLVIRSKIAVPGIALLAVIAVDARAQDVHVDRVTVAPVDAPQPDELHPAMVFRTRRPDSKNSIATDQQQQQQQQ